MTVGTRTLPLTGSGDTTAEAAVDTIAGVDYPFSKLTDGTTDSTTPIKAGGGVEANALRVTIASDSTGVVSVDDNGSTLSVDDGGGNLSVDDGGGSLTVDGTVTANAGTNLNTSALALESGGNLAGAATSLAVVDDWDESDRAKVNLIAGQAGVAGGSGTVSALTQRVVLATDVALPAGTNAIGKLAANSGVDIGDVDVTSVPAPLSTTGGGTEAAALRVTVANDSTGVLSIDDNGGSLTVDGSVTANAGTNLNTSALALESGGNLAAVAASASVIDDWDESDRAKVNPIAGQAGVQGGSGAVSALTQRVVLATDVALPAGTNAIGKLAANSGVDIGDVDVTSVVPGTGASNLGKAEDAAHTTGDVGVMMLGVRNEEGDNTLSGAVGDYTPIATDAMGAVLVAGNPNGNAVFVTLTSQAVTLEVQGATAHDGSDAGNPIKIGGKARTTNPAAVADGDRVDGTFDDIGRQVVVPFGVRDLVSHQHTQIASSSSETTIVTAGGAGVFHDLLSLILTNQTATAVNVTIKDATGGTTRMVIALAASGGAVITFPAPVNQASANGNWTATLSSAAVTVNIFAQFVKNV